MTHSGSLNTVNLEGQIANYSNAKGNKKSSYGNDKSSGVVAPEVQVL